MSKRGAQRRNRIAVKSGLVVVLALGFFCVPAATAKDKKVTSGETQVVANVGGREVTISEVRIEMQKLGLDPLEASAERRAFESLRDRILIVKEAEAAKIHKRPEALWRMEAAREQALTELYLGIIAQPPEPSQIEVEEYILDNPTLFSKAKNYTFSVIEIDSKDLDLEVLTPLFDEKPDFSVLRAALEVKGITYTLSEAVRPAAGFPEAIRLQLSEYSTTDNIVLQGDVRTSIMKITKIESAGLSLTSSIPLARALLKQQESQNRVRRKIEQLRKNTAVAIYRESVKPTVEMVEGAK